MYHILYQNCCFMKRPSSITQRKPVRKKIIITPLLRTVKLRKKNIKNIYYNNLFNKVHTVLSNNTVDIWFSMDKELHPSKTSWKKKTLQCYYLCYFLICVVIFKGIYCFEMQNINNHLIILATRKSWCHI